MGGGDGGMKGGRREGGGVGILMVIMVSCMAAIRMTTVYGRKFRSIRRKSCNDKFRCPKVTITLYTTYGRCAWGRVAWYGAV